MLGLFRDKSEAEAFNLLLDFVWRFLLQSAHLSTYFGQRFVNPDSNLLGGL